MYAHEPAGKLAYETAACPDTPPIRSRLEQLRNNINTALTCLDLAIDRVQGSKAPPVPTSNSAVPDSIETWLTVLEHSACELVHKADRLAERL